MLTSPVTYQGGKTRIAKDIVDIILNDSQIDAETRFYDLCCGSGSISIEMFNRDIFDTQITMIDSSVWGEFWRSIGNGEFLIDMFEIYIKNIPQDKEDIESYIKDMVKESPYDGVSLSNIYRFLIIQANAFGGTPVWIENMKWKKAGGYRSFWKPTETSNRRSVVNPMMPMPETLFERVSKIWSEMYLMVEGRCANAQHIFEFPKNSIIYLDPPYKNTSQYGYDFDINKWIKGFVESSDNCVAFISESFPIGNEFYLISEPRNKGNISGNSKSKNSEYLSVIRC